MDKHEYLSLFFWFDREKLKGYGVIVEVLFTLPGCIQLPLSVNDEGIVPDRLQYFHIPNIQSIHQGLSLTYPIMVRDTSSGGVTVGE